MSQLHEHRYDISLSQDVFKSQTWYFYQIVTLTLQLRKNILNDVHLAKNIKVYSLILFPPMMAKL